MEISKTMVINGIEFEREFVDIKGNPIMQDEIIVSEDEEEVTVEVEEEQNEDAEEVTTEDEPKEEATTE